MDFKKLVCDGSSCIVFVQIVRRMIPSNVQLKISIVMKLKSFVHLAGSFRWLDAVLHNLYPTISFLRQPKAPPRPRSPHVHGVSPTASTVVISPSAPHAPFKSNLLPPLNNTFPRPLCSSLKFTITKTSALVSSSSIDLTRFLCPCYDRGNVYMFWPSCQTGDFIK